MLPKPRTTNRSYTTVSIPISLVNRIDKYLTKKNAIYKSKVDFVLSAIRKELKNLGLLEPDGKPVLAHFNLDEEGVRILDRDINFIVDVAFKPEGIWCKYCQAEMCRHIQFALTVPEIQDVIHKRHREGWKLPEV